MLASIASLLALHERPRLGAQHFIDVVGAHDGADVLAIVVQGVEFDADQRIQRRAFVEVDLDLDGLFTPQPHRDETIGGAQYPGWSQYVANRQPGVVDQRVGRLPQHRGKNATQMPVQRFRIHRLHEHQVDVFRITCGRRQMRLVQDRAATHGQMLAQDGVGEDGGHATG